MVNKLTPLPNFLVNRYKNWIETSYSLNVKWFEKIATEGQKPKAMIVSC